MMRAKYFLFTLICFGATLLSPHAHAQVNEAATGNSRHVWGGVEFSNFKPDYNFGRLDGIGFYGDYEVTRRFGLEGEVRLLDLNKPAGQIQKDFLGGGYGNVYRYRDFTAYAKFLVGAKTITFPENIGYGSYFAFVPGGGVEYRFRPRIKIRGEYEYQLIPSAPGFPGQPSNGLTPNGFSVGVSYRIF